MPDPAPAPPEVGRAICITGMHRSGTSLAARALHLLGVSLGAEDQLMGSGHDNPTGYWENRYVREVDDLVLAALGGSWDRPPPLAPGWEHDPALAPLRDEAAGILDAAFGPPGRRPAAYGWKDPRLCLLQPFWEAIVPVAATVLVVRDPAQVADSLAARNGLSAPHAAALWLRHLLAATAPGRAPVIVVHHELVADLPGHLRSLARALGLAPPTDAALAAAAAHLDPSLQHHTRRAEDAGGAPDDGNPLVRLAAEVFAGGAIDREALPPVVAEAIAGGWLTAPAGADEAARARARAVDLEEQLRRQRRRWDAERAERSPQGGRR